MQQFITEHRALILKHARAYVRAHAEKIAAEDVAHEMELVLAQLGQACGLVPRAVVAPDAYLRSIVRPAAGRAKRRKTLITQVAAGDDLRAVSDDLAALDGDLPPRPAPPTQEATEAQAVIESFKATLSAPDALIFALSIEDELSVDDVARVTEGMPDEVELVLKRILALAAQKGVADSTRALFDLTGRAFIPAPTTPHVEEPLLALIRAGDMGEDIFDAVNHVARCPDCRALITEGAIERRSVVVVAIEAARTSQTDLARVAEQANAHLVGRGSGRWTAVVDAEHATTFRERLEKPGVSGVSRLVMANAVDVPVGDKPAQGPARPSPYSIPPMPNDVGIAAAEVSAWAQVARVPKKKAPRPNPVWAAFAVLAVLGAMAIAYVLATHTP